MKHVILPATPSLWMLVLCVALGVKGTWSAHHNTMTTAIIYIATTVTKQRGCYGPRFVAVHNKPDGRQDTDHITSTAIAEQKKEWATVEGHLHWSVNLVLLDLVDFGIPHLKHIFKDPIQSLLQIYIN